MPNFTPIPVSRWFNKKYYVYTLSSPTVGVFYVGKGTRGRMFIHEHDAAKGMLGPKYDTIRKIWQNGEQITKSIVYQSDYDQEASRVEITLIKDHSRIKPIANLAHARPIQIKNQSEKLLDALERLYPTYDDDQIATLKEDIVARGLIDSIFD
jgi:hypothetical protein